MGAIALLLMFFLHPVLAIVLIVAAFALMMAFGLVVLVDDCLRQQFPLVPAPGVAALLLAPLVVWFMAAAWSR